MRWGWSIVCAVGLIGCSLLTDLDALTPAAGSDGGAPNLDGVFVDGKAGNDFNGGTRTAPVKTITKGIALAKQQAASVVYVCAQGAPYDEHVTLDAAISLHGSVTCKDAPSPWTGTDDRTVITPSTPGPALTISGAAGVTILGFALSTPDGTTASPDSVVAVVSTSSVTLDHVTIQAGKGTAGGAKTATPDNHVTLTPANPSVNQYSGGPAVTCTCGDGTKTTGGKGSGSSSQNGGDGAPALGGGKGGIPVANGQSAVPCNGGNGADGSAGAMGTAAPMRTLGAAGLSADLPGGYGQDGTVAQGGGGGGDYQSCSGCGWGAGGGGGCGGCGGAGGKGGVSGGWSVALVVFRGTITMAMSSVTASAAGDGQAGGDAQVGEMGEGGGAGDGKYFGCTGGSGGNGKSGGAGAGGNGGSSIAIASTKDSTLTLDTTSESGLKTGALGKGAPGGIGGPGGVDGIAATKAPFN